jgi:hypothetical protein
MLHDRTLTVSAAQGVLANDINPDGGSMWIVPVPSTAWPYVPIASDGSINFIPPPGFVGTATEQYYAVNSTGPSAAPATLTVTVTDQPPVGVADAYAVAPGQALSVDAAHGVLANDSDPDGDPLSAVLQTQPSHGTILFGSDGSFVYTPSAGFTGADQWTYKASDGAMTSGVTQVTINVAPLPTVSFLTSATTVNESSQSATIDIHLSAPSASVVTVGYTTLDGTALAGQNYSAISGTLAFQPGQTDQVFTVTILDNQLPDPDLEFDMFLSNPLGATLAAPWGETVTIHDDDAPQTGPSPPSVAFASDTATVPESSPTATFTVQLSAPATTIVTASYTTVDGTALAGQNYSATSGTVTFQPGQTQQTISVGILDDHQVDPGRTFDLSLTSASGALNDGISTVTATIHDDDAPPPASLPVVSFSAAMYQGSEHGQPVTITATLSASSSQTVTVVYATDPNGARYQQASGTLTFAPGQTTATFTVQPRDDGQPIPAEWSPLYLDSPVGATLGTAMASLMILDDDGPPPGPAPVASSDSYSGPHDLPLTVLAQNGVLQNDYSPAYYPIVAILTQQSPNGSVALGLDGSFVFTPNAGFSGTTQFSYKDWDGVNYSAPTQVTLTITNQSPIVQDSWYSVSASGPTTIAAAQGVLANAFDPDNQTLTATLASAPQNGAVQLSPDGSFVYTPGPNFVSSDSFIITVTDGVNVSNTATIHLQTGMVAIDDAYTVTHDQPLLIQATSGVMVNDQIGMPNVKAVLVSNPSHGIAALNSSGALCYVPAAGYSGSDSLTYQLTDGVHTSNVATVHFNVESTAPVATDCVYQTVMNTPLQVSDSGGVLSGSYSPDGTPLTAILDRQAQNGTVTLRPGGGFVYTPNPGFVGQDKFLFHAFNGILAGNQAVAQLLVGAAIGQPPPGQITISGTLAYDIAHPHPVRFALVELASRVPGGDFVQQVGVTSETGQYSFTIQANVFAPNSLVIRALTVEEPPVGTARSISVVDYSVRLTLPGGLVWFLAPLWVATNPAAFVALGGSISLVPKAYSQDFRLRANYDVNLVKSFTIGKGTLSERAFWTYDASVTASLVHSNLPGVPIGRTLVEFCDDSPTLSPPTGCPPWLETPIITNINFDDWDVIVHEYGHLVQQVSGFFPFDLPQYALYPLLLSNGQFTPPQISMNVAPAEHDSERNLRVDEPYVWRAQLNKMAFSEGWASFYSIAAQFLDPRTPQGADTITSSLNPRNSKSGDLLYSEQDIETEPARQPANVQDDPGNLGEDNEVTVMRTLWDVFDSGTNEALDRISLSLSQVFTCIVNGGTPTLTLSDFYQSLLRFFNNDRQKQIDVGALFQLDNLSPSVQGIQLRGANTVQISQNDTAIPVFVWAIPQGHLGEALVARLLNQFTVRVLNADLTQTLLTSQTLNISDVTILDDGLVAGVPQRPTTVWWRPSPVQWAAVKNVLGVKHLIVSGRLSTTYIAPFLSGRYSSDAFDFQITP